MGNINVRLTEHKENLDLTERGGGEGMHSYVSTPEELSCSKRGIHTWKSVVFTHVGKVLFTHEKTMFKETSSEEAS